MDYALHFSIQDLGARYAQAIDDDRLEEWPEFFTEKGRYIVTTADTSAGFARRTYLRDVSGHDPRSC